MNTFNIIIISIGICAAVLFGFLINEARQPGWRDGLFIDHEILGKMREEWIEYGKNIQKEEKNAENPQER